MQASHRIRAVIFDFGGVITTSPFEAFNRLEAERALPHDFYPPYQRHEPRHQRLGAVRTRRNQRRTIRRAVCARGRDGRPDARWRIGAGGPRRRSATRNGHRARSTGGGGAIAWRASPTMCPPATAPAWRATPTIRWSRVRAIREHVIESSKAGVRKPDPRIYTMMTDHLGLPPEACVYLDDLGINCKPAAALGMHAIKVTSGEQALADLSAVLNITLS